MKHPIELHTVPEKSGVYVMRDSSGHVLYVGKAKNLRSRLSTYFSRGGDDRAQIPYLLSQVESVETIVVPSEIEALLLEARLIRQWKPKYNILLKDDKSYLRIRLDERAHPYPRIELFRSKPGSSVPKGSFGPFVSSSFAFGLFEVLIRFFRLRQCTDEEFKRRKKPCLLYQLKRCSGPCVGHISEKEYQASVHSARMLLEGRKTEIFSTIDQMMKEASDRLDFEQASLLLKQKKILEQLFLQTHSIHVSEEHALDAFAMYQEGENVSLCVMSYRHGALVRSRTLHFVLDPLENSIDGHQVLLQYYRDVVASEELPREVLVSFDLEEKESLEEALFQECRVRVAIHRPKIGRKKDVLALAEENARVAFVQKTTSDSQVHSLLQALEETLELDSLPHVIDCFDVSHLSGRERVASCVSFFDGRPNKKRYRTFKIKALDKKDDCSMISEAIVRRYADADTMPDLILVDGGRLQLKAALDSLEQLGLLSIPVRAISKEGGRHDRGLTEENVWLPTGTEPLRFEKTSPLLHFLQRVRDEAHRFAIAFQTKRRKVALLTSQLDGIRGIGPKKKKALLTAFSGIAAIKRASEDELCQKAGVSKKDAVLLKLIL